MRVPTCNRCKLKHFNFQSCAEGERKSRPVLTVRQPLPDDVREWKPELPARTPGKHFAGIDGYAGVKPAPREGE